MSQNADEIRNFTQNLQNALTDYKQRNQARMIRTQEILAELGKSEEKKIDNNDARISKSILNQIEGEEFSPSANSLRFR